MSDATHSGGNPGGTLPPLHSELLLLPDGRVLVHNLTPAFARFLSDVGLPDARIPNPNDGVKHELRESD